MPSYFLALTLIIPNLLLSTLSQSLCRRDSDCTSYPHHYESDLRLGEYACIKNECKFVVAAGEICGVSSDCAAYHYLQRNNQTIPENFCSTKYCTIESTCGGAWSLPNSPDEPDSDGGLTCCSGLEELSTCSIVSHVDPCRYASYCSIEEEKSVGECVNINTRQHLWIGIVLVLSGGTILNVGLNIQKLAFRKHEEKTRNRQIIAETMNSLTSQNSQRSSNELSQVLTSESDNVKPQSRFKRILPHLMFWKSIPLSPLWFLGLLIFICGNLLSFVALRFAPQSLVAPLGSISLVSNVILAPLLNHEKWGMWDLTGIGLIVCGSVIVIVFSGIVAHDYKLCVLLNLFHQGSTIIFLCVIGALIVFTFFTIKILERYFKKRRQTLNNHHSMRSLSSNADQTSSKIDFTLPEASGSTTIKPLSSFETDPAESTNEEPKNPYIHHNERPDENTLESFISKHTTLFKYVLPLSYACLGSLTASLTTLFAKSLINLLTVTFIQKDNQFDDAFAWMIFIITATTAVSQVYWINMGLKRYDALLQVPVFYVVWTLFDIIGGGIYYNEFKAFDLKQYFLFSLGVLIIFSGVAVLAKRLKSIEQS